MSSLKRVQRPVVCLPICLGLFIVIGCGRNGLEPDYDKLGLVEVSGRVTLDGQPLAGVQVVFEESQFIYSYGDTDQEGRYQLMFDSRKSGIMPGKKTVRFRPRTISEAEGGGAGKAGAGETESDDPDVSSGGLPPIPDCYKRGSKIQVEVTPSTKSFNFSLKSDCSTTSSDS